MSISKPFAPACERNQQPIAEILKPVFQSVNQVLEIGSGTGQHAVYFAGEMPWLQWQPSDVEENIAGIQAWVNDAALPNLSSPLVLDVNDDHWPENRFDALFTANSLHIMSWNSVRNFMQNAAQRLDLNGYLATYGPFNYGGNYTSASNAQFDQWLKQQSQQSAIRNFEDMAELAAQHALELYQDYAMPANNRLLLWKKTS
jgi:cyclopropane fatty-acyl-phospholipid synthase-like methyltransferase